VATTHQDQHRPRLTSRGAITRARIIEAAADLVYARGVGGTSLDDIMAASETSKSQLYHYFSDKDALIHEVIVLQMRRVIEGQEPYLHRVDSFDGLRRWADAVAELNRAAGGAGGCPLGSLASELADQSEGTRELLAHCFRIWQSYLVEGLRAMRDRGDLVPDAEPDDLAAAIMAALQGGVLLAQTNRTVRPLELALDMAIGHVARHLR
jgi:AcrR family transcriptional regulator